MYKLLAFLFLLIAFISCSSEKKLKRGDTLPQKQEKVTLYNLKINNFPEKDLILNDINFIGYLNLKILRNNELFDNFLNVLRKDYFIAGNLSDFYFTASDIYKSQEFLFFLDNYQISYNKKFISKKQIANKMLYTVNKTDNQEFGFINFENNACIYGDTALIKELFNIYDKKTEPISDKRYEIFVDSGFLKSDTDIKLIFMPNSEYEKLLLEFSEKQPFFKLFLLNLNYVFLEVKLQRDNVLNVALTISKKESVAKLFVFLNTQHKLLLTLNGNPYSTLNSQDIFKNNEFFKSLKIEKQDENKLKISVKIKETDFGNLIKLLNKITGIK